MEAEGFSSILCFQAHPASCTMGTGVLAPGVKRGRGVMLTSHLLLVPRLRKSRSCTSSPPKAPQWRGAWQLYFTLVCNEIAALQFVEQEESGSCVGNVATSSGVRQTFAGMVRVLKWVRLPSRYHICSGSAFACRLTIGRCVSSPDNKALLHQRWTSW
jgi:hypothetical protein